MTTDTIISGAWGDYPFPTPEVSLTPEQQVLYDAWLQQREAKERITVEDRIRAVRESPQALTRIALMGVFMMLLAGALLIVFRRLARRRRELETHLTGCTKGRIIKIRQGAIGRRIVRYATVAYLRDGYPRQDEYLLAPEMVPQEGDEITVYYDPADPAASEIGGIGNTSGKEYDVVLIPFLVIGLILFLWAILP